MQQNDSNFYFGLLHDTHHSTSKHKLDKQGQNIDLIKIRDEMEMNIQGNLLKVLLWPLVYLCVESTKEMGSRRWSAARVNPSASHHIYRRPFVSSWGVLALAFSDTA